MKQNHELIYDPHCGEEDEELNRRIQGIVRLDREKSKLLGRPTAEYDKEKKQPYLLYPDGRREYLEDIKAKETT